MTKFNDMHSHLILYSQGKYKTNVPFMDVMTIISYYKEGFREGRELTPKQTYIEVLSIFNVVVDESTKINLMETMFKSENFISMASLTERMLSRIGKIDIELSVEPNADILPIKK